MDGWLKVGLIIGVWVFLWIY